MKTLTASAVSLAIALTSSAAFPCGASFGAEEVKLDSQQDIIIVHKGTKETYVFRPKFCGNGGDFGLILPVPSLLLEQPALSSSVPFEHLDSISRPNVVTTKECTKLELMPGGGADESDPGDRGTTVVASGQVGILDWVQLKAESTNSFTSWLEAGGYRYEPGSSDAFQHYVTKGWYFLAFKIGNSDGAGSYLCRELGPIRFAFTSQMPVVPSRMANANSSNDSFRWRIFGITQGAEQIDFARPGVTDQKLGYSGALTPASVENLDGLAEAGDRASMLSLKFSRSTEDVPLTKTPGADYRETKHIVTTVKCQGCSTRPLPLNSRGPTWELLVFLLWGLECARPLRKKV